MTGVETIDQYSMSYNEHRKAVLHDWKSYSYDRSTDYKQSSGYPLDVKVFHNVLYYRMYLKYNY